MNGRSQRSLKNVLINKHVQLSMVLINLLHMFFAMLITIVLILSPVITLLYQENDSELQFYAAQMFMVLTEQLPLAILIVSILFVTHQIVVSHRFCGPVVNFGHTFRKIAQGDLTRKIYLRPKDFLKNEQVAINTMMDELSVAIGSIKRNNDVLATVIQNIKVNSTSEKEVQESEKALKTSTELVHIINEKLAKFKLSKKNTQNNKEPDKKSS